MRPERGTDGCGATHRRPRMNPSVTLPIVAASVLCASLLWLAAELVEAAESRPVPVARAVLGVAVALAAGGLWWPAQALSAQLPGHDFLGSVMLLLICAALAGCAIGANLLWQRERRRAALGAALALPVLAYGLASAALPGLFRFAAAPGGLGAGSLMAVLAAALAVSQWRFDPRLRARAARLGAVAVAGSVLGFGAAVSAPAVGSARAQPGADWLAMAALVALGGVLLVVLRSVARGTPGGPVRPTRAAAVDHLTGLPTRLFFEGQLHRAAKLCNTRHTRLAVLFIDLDGFKPVNDTFGHSSGDRVLQQVGGRLKALARKAGVAARVGGDEFLLLATGVTTVEGVTQLASQLIEALSRPYRIDERDVTIACSVGIALYPQKCEPSKLIARADAAMYAAKRAGGARHCFYSSEMDADVQKNFDTLRDLRSALAKDELELFFQPKIDARSGKVTAAEALVRWNHPSRGQVMPDEFVPLAERSGLIGPLGNWVIEAACKQARAWRDKGLRMRVAINLSAHQMRQEDIVDRIAEALARHRIRPLLLTCEITESAAMEDTAATQETFRRLGELGVHLSIDDFGTGYSSLSYLRRLPAEELKIDASFVQDLGHSADARAVVDAVVKLAHALGLKVVAEGVETVRQQKILVDLGCDELQGYLFAKPMSARALLLWALEDRSSSAAFRDSLFGETRQATREMLTRPGLERVA